MDNHMIGFEKEAALQTMHAHPDIHSRLYMWQDFMAVARVINPDLCSGAFERRACERRLRYIGKACLDEPFRSEPDEGPYVYGEIYHSVDFNGATYTIKETSKIKGCAYFEVEG